MKKFLILAAIAVAQFSMAQTTRDVGEFSSGISAEQDIIVNSGSKFSGKDLDSEKVKVASNAGGNATVNASESVTATTRAGGVMDVYGDPGERNIKNIIGGKINFECPAPTRNHFLTVCNSIFSKEYGKDDTEFSYQYQEDLWKMSCAVPGVDSPEIANEKIRKMWMKNREKFKCESTLVSLPGGNVLKFALETNLSTFVVHAVKIYKLDMNFKDPKDGLTILDFVLEQQKKYASSKYSKDKVDEYIRIYNILLAGGAKHGKDL